MTRSYNSYQTNYFVRNTLVFTAWFVIFVNSLRKITNNNYTINMENEKKLTRSSNRMIAGVCAGIAEYLGWDPTLLRIVYVLATFFTAFAGVIIYIILWIVMPYKNDFRRE